MSQRLPQEHPPSGEDARIEWLTRLVILINGAFDLVYDLEPEGFMPSKISDGMFRFFGQAILPDIPYAGPWIVINGVWEPMVEQNTPAPPVSVQVVTNTTAQAESNVEQSNTVVDVNIPITFGAGSGNVNDAVMIDSSGLITFNLGGDYHISMLLNASRDNSNQVAYLVLSSVVNGAVPSYPLVISIDKSGDNIPVPVRIPVTVSDGDTLQFMQARDSSGPNDGGLFPFATSLPGLPDVPSARILITSQEVVI